MQLFHLYQPTVKELPIVANIPHSGLFVPEDIAAQFTSEHLNSLPHSDWHLDKLYDFLPSLGITVLQATHNRYVVDLNRQVKEPLFGSFWSSVILGNTAFNQDIYQCKPSQKQIEERIEKYYLPYHHQLKSLLQQKIAEFGKVYLLDLHSFRGLINDDVCLGNVNNQTCSEKLISTVDKCFSSQGLEVVRNKKFIGGYITRHYGEMPDVESLQVEVRYHVYLQENQIDKPEPPSYEVTEFKTAKKKFNDIFEMMVSKLFID
ncbi:N-formylglutamate amidohydrolase superfamily protein [Calothrix parasitica NIES-267]|uniref:N-formylglutamate amidohydrolase superfamily protein n=1 Tax=Calothrix parasitica NIES-267 TaxID=1973488 RepID=A0A1Z4LS97_9CYAN|nr:N-formylglutamate amidohydrolase superfamily protein [Calothrix parasitica NIES-267]